MDAINQTMSAENSTMIDSWTQSDYDFFTSEKTTKMPEEYSPLRTTWYHKVIFITMYSGIVIFAIVGNAIVCYIVIQSPRMRTVTNFFIATLAISDMLMATLCIPFTFVAAVLLNYWPFGTAMCPIVQFVQTVAVFLSTHTLVAISIDRWVWKNWTKWKNSMHQIINWEISNEMSSLTGFVCIRWNSKPHLIWNFKGENNNKY